MSQPSLQTDSNKPAENGAQVSAWTCPECSGTIWATEAPAIHLQCRVGHSYLPQSFLEEQEQTIEHTMWAVVRLLQERAAFQEYLASYASSLSSSVEGQQLQASAAKSEKYADAVQSLLGEIMEGSTPRMR